MTPEKLAVTYMVGERTDTGNTQLAATLGAFDVPLKTGEPFSTQVGDGIRGVRVTWHFDPLSKTNTKATDLVRLWGDAEWRAANREHPLSCAWRAFKSYREMVLQIRGGEPVINRWTGSDPTHATGDTRKAACIESLGHPLLGYTQTGDWWMWHFPQAAAADLALYDKQDLCETLPHATISYVRAALLNYATMIRWIKDIQTCRIVHKGRIALVGVNAPQSTKDIIEKLLYR
jgi:hypothetical protein